MTREQLRKLAGDEIFTAGLQFYQNNGVREMPRSPISAASNQLQFVVNDNPRRTVAIRADARAALCNCVITVLAIFLGSALGRCALRGWLYQYGAMLSGAILVLLGAVAPWI